MKIFAIALLVTAAFFAGHFFGKVEAPIVHMRIQGPDILNNWKGDNPTVVCSSDGKWTNSTIGSGWIVGYAMKDESTAGNWTGESGMAKQ